MRKLDIAQLYDLAMAELDDLRERAEFYAKERDDYKNRIDGTANLLSELRLKYGATNFETFPDFIKRLCSERDDARALARKYYQTWRELDELFEIGTPAGLAFARHEVAVELKEARSWAIYWRKMFNVQLYENAVMDCKVYIAEDERSEAVRDLVDAENEIKRLRLLILNIWEMGDIELPRVSNNFGCATCAWCSECGCDVVVVEHGKFQCAECGK